MRRTFKFLLLLACITAVVALVGTLAAAIWRHWTDVLFGAYVTGAIVLGVGGPLWGRRSRRKTDISHTMHFLERDVTAAKRSWFESARRRIALAADFVCGMLAWPSFSL